MPIDYKKYPANWLSEIRPAILKRANEKCEECGVVNYSWINKRTREICLQDEENTIYVVLTIAHLNHDINDNREENLKALCQKCHLHHDREHHTRSRKYGKNHRLNQKKIF